MADNISVAYFSGTGGTERAAKSLVQALEARGASVSLVEIRQGADTAAAGANYLALLFPVHAFNAPLPVYRWLEALENVNGTSAAVIAVSGGGEIFPNTACRRSCLARLRRKGYNVIYEDAIVMPTNIFEPTPSDAAARLMRVLPKKTDMIAQDILARREKALKAKLFDRLCSWLFEIEKTGAKHFGRQYYATDECTGCGLCSENCPAGNISMEGDKPVFGSDCCLCLKCVYACPTGAIRLKRYKFALINEGFDISDIEKRPIDETQPLPGSLAWKGLRLYLEELEREQGKPAGIDSK